MISLVGVLLNNFESHPVVCVTFKKINFYKVSIIFILIEKQFSYVVKAEWKKKLNEQKKAISIAENINQSVSVRWWKKGRKLNSINC